MNKKGFTLIELLATITIMTIIATVASVNIVNIFNNKKQETIKLEEDIITSAACVFIELKENEDLKDVCYNEGCDITTEELVSAGLINKNDVDNSKVIHISKENMEKKCIIKED